jgi:hypothetical protein
MSRNRTQWYLVLAGVASLVLAALVLAALSSRPLQIAWHRSEMDNAFSRLKNERIYENGSIFLSTRHLEKFERHRDELVRLRALIRREYQFLHVWVPTAQSKNLLGSLLKDEGPPRVYWDSIHPQTKEKLQLTVWCWPNDVPDWETFIKAADKPAEDSSRSE